MMVAPAPNATTLTRDDFLSMFMGFAGQANTIHIPKAYLALCDFDFPAAALLSQILYWMPRAKHKDGWVVKSYAEWCEEICLTEYQIRRATTKLKKMGLKTVLKRSGLHRGAPTVHYLMEREAFTDCIMKFLKNRETKESHSEVSKESHSEETQETFTKISTKTLQREKESPIEKALDQKPTDSPIGDSLPGNDPVAKGDALLEEAFANLAGSLSVKAEDPDSKPADSKTTEKILPPPRKAKAAGPAPAATDPTAPSPRNALQDAVVYAMDVPAGSQAGMIGNFFAGMIKKSKDKKSDEWFACQPTATETPDLIPQQIIAFTLWYSMIPKYASSYAERKALPMTPRILCERWDEFRGRDQKTRDFWMGRAIPVLERLAKGEQVQADAASTGPVESAQSFKRYDPKASDPYAVRTDPDNDPDNDPENSPEEEPVGAFS